MSKYPNTNLVIIPTYNEKENIVKMIDTVMFLNENIDLLIIDDNSPDETAKYVKDLQNKYNNRLHLIQRSGKLGLGTAYVAGFKYALENNYQHIMEMDCDFSHNPKDLLRFLDIIDKYDLVIGSRYIEGVNVLHWPLRRLILSMGASLYTRIITGMPIKDTTSGFKCFRREVLASIDLDSIKSNGYSFQIEMHYKTWKKGFRIKEIPITFTDRIDGTSKMGAGIIKEAIFAVWKLRFPKLFKD